MGLVNIYARAMYAGPLSDEQTSAVGALRVGYWNAMRSLTNDRQNWFLDVVETTGGSSKFVESNVDAIENFNLRLLLFFPTLADFICHSDPKLISEIYRFIFVKCRIHDAKSCFLRLNKSEAIPIEFFDFQDRIVDALPSEVDIAPEIVDINVDIQFDLETRVFKFASTEDLSNALAMATIQSHP